jgi:hypothetical protein
LEVAQAGAWLVSSGGFSLDMRTIRATSPGSSCGRLTTRHEVDKDSWTGTLDDVAGLHSRPLQGTIAIDFLVAPTVSFRLLYVFFVLSLRRRGPCM